MVQVFLVHMGVLFKRLDGASIFREADSQWINCLNTNQALVSRSLHSGVTFMRWHEPISHSFLKQFQTYFMVR
jgi:hypothetical protein